MEGKGQLFGQTFQFGCVRGALGWGCVRKLAVPGELGE